MIVVRLIGVLIDCLLLPLRLMRLRSARRQGTWLTVTIDGPVVDILGRPRFWQLRKQKALSLHVLDEVVTAMLRDPAIKGLLVTIRTMNAGMATATSLRALLERARAGGKEVVVHLPMGGDTKEVYVATAATKVLLGPATLLSPLGFRSAARYMKSALDRAGIEPQVFACGEFKSAGETLVRDSMSPAQRAQLDRLLDTFHAAVVDGIANGRNIPRERAAELVDHAPYFGREAIDIGLADELAYEDEVPRKIGIDDGGHERKLLDAGAYLARVKRPLLRRLVPPPVIAVVPMHGAITHAAGPFGDLSTDERVTRTVRAVRKDPRVKGVILHIDSPGGSALASDLMHHEIEQLGREKPVVACMANVAASGGYYVAAPAACIVARPTTVTGSIGVVAARLDVEPLLARIGVRTEVVERGRHASLLSPTGPLDAEARGAIERELAATYRAFVGIVAAGRKMPEDDVEKLARGRVYTGEDALDMKLVDVLGGLETAIDEVKKRLDARIRDRVEVQMAKTPRHHQRVLDLPKKDEAARSAARALLTALLPSRDRILLELAASGEPIVALGPITET